MYYTEVNIRLNEINPFVDILVAKLNEIEFESYEEDENVDTIVYNMFTLKQVMVKTVTCVKASDTIYDVAKILAKENFHALPVEEDGKLVGIVTTTDLITYLLEQY